MAIDPAVLEQQRGTLRIVGGRPAEYSCPRCGTRTKDRSGICMRCQKAHLPDLSKMPTQQIVGYIAACRAELKRRQDEIAAALGEP